MFSGLYQTLSDIGYTHPLHPALTHIPVGLVIGGFIFALFAVVLNRSSLSKTARHCLWLALIALPFAALFGWMDWQQYYAGAWLLPIIIKMILGALLFVLLLVTLISSREKTPLFYHAICMLVVITIGFFGGELVYGKRNMKMPANDSRIEQGADLFAQNCSMCHYADRTDKHIGPGLKGLFQMEKLPVSGKPVTAENVEQQIKNPFENMPAFTDLKEDEIEALLEYLRTL